MFLILSHRTTGITPAYAGNTTTTKNKSSVRKDHPRIRGEHYIVSMEEYGSLGSPPHTRGTLLLIIHSNYSLRITPAYAGNTVLATPIKAANWDHPRIRGEHPIKYRDCRHMQGSPPHTRGTQ